MFSFPIFSFFLVSIDCSFLVLKSFSSVSVAIGRARSSPAGKGSRARLFQCSNLRKGKKGKKKESQKNNDIVGFVSPLSAGHQLRGSCSLLPSVTRTGVVHKHVSSVIRHCCWLVCLLRGPTCHKHRHHFPSSISEKGPLHSCDALVSWSLTLTPSRFLSGSTFHNHTNHISRTPPAVSTNTQPNRLSCVLVYRPRYNYTSGRVAVSPSFPHLSPSPNRAHRQDGLQRKQKRLDRRNGGRKPPIGKSFTRHSHSRTISNA